MIEHPFEPPGQARPSVAEPTELALWARRTAIPKFVVGAGVTSFAAQAVGNLLVPLSETAGDGTRQAAVLVVLAESVWLLACGGLAAWAGWRASRAGGGTPSSVDAAWRAELWFWRVAGGGVLVGVATFVVGVVVVSLG